MPITPLLHITAAYSNAVLTAILPQVSDCAKTMDLPISQPVTMAQVGRFVTSPSSENVGGGLWLTNHYWFDFGFGYVGAFHSPDDWFASQDIDGLERFVGKDNMTTNAAIEMARHYFVILGYDAKKYQVDNKPTKVEGPFDNMKIGHVPYCEITWESPEATTLEERHKSYTVQFDIDLQRKQVVGMNLFCEDFFLPNPKLDVVTETEADYRKRIKGSVPR